MYGDGARQLVGRGQLEGDPVKIKNMVKMTTGCGCPIELA
jgi:hypothetical protein